MRKMALLIAGVVFLVVASANLETLPEYAKTLPAPLRGTFLFIHVWQWAFMVALLVIGVVAGAIGRTVARRLTFLRDKVVPHAMSEGTRLAIGRSAGLLSGSIVVAGLVPSLKLPDTILVDGRKLGVEFEGHLMALNYCLIALSCTMFFYAYWEAICDSLAASAAGIQRAERLLVPMMRKLVQAIIVLIGILVILAILFGAKTLTGLVAGLGVTGLVVALAGKDSIENLFGSLTILFDMPFALGDYVKIDKVEGAVEEINLRSTRIRTTEDTLITLPNANLIRASVENFGARRMRRQKLNLRLNFASEPKAIDRFCDSLREFLNVQEDVEVSKTQVQLDDPTETSIGVIIIWFLHADSVLKEAQSRSRLLEEALRLKTTHGLVLMSLPTPDTNKG
jgi:MscS family membrane protein